MTRGLVMRRRGTRCGCRRRQPGCGSSRHPGARTDAACDRVPACQGRRGSTRAPRGWRRCPHRGASAGLARARSTGLRVVRQKVRVVVRSLPVSSRRERRDPSRPRHRGCANGFTARGARSAGRLAAARGRRAGDGDTRPGGGRSQGFGSPLEQVGTLEWQRAGIDGSGVKVAVIDLGFAGYASRLGSDLPASVATIDHCGGSSRRAAGTRHGTAVAQVVHQTAPGAQLKLICVDSEVGLALGRAGRRRRGVGRDQARRRWINTSRGDGSGGRRHARRDRRRRTRQRDPLGERGRRRALRPTGRPVHARLDRT